ncbi:MAG: hypothetical protein NTY05_03420 [Rhodocyclales bacterium]|nr:hypothetical protein [Rhodocyclales bacterium]
MQDALGADSTDLNWSAQPSSNYLATDTGLHSFFCISFAPLIHTITRRADALDGGSRVRPSRRSLSRDSLLRDAESCATDELLRDPCRRVPDRQCAALQLVKYDD